MEVLAVIGVVMLGLSGVPLVLLSIAAIGELFADEDTSTVMWLATVGALIGTCLILFAKLNGVGAT